MCFFSPPSFCESPLSRRLFRLTATSMLSGMSLVFFCITVDDDDDDDDGVFATADDGCCCCCFSVVLVVTVVVVLAFAEAFFFGFPLCTWVHPSSSLSGWSPVSALGLSQATVAVAFVDGVVVAAATAVVATVWPGCIIF